MIPRPPDQDPRDEPAGASDDDLAGTVMDKLAPTILRQGDIASLSSERLRVGDLPREIPVRLGKYLIDEVVGRGAVGVVYRARQEGLERPVALKLLLQGAHASPHTRQRFSREARAMAKLRHPNIVAVHEVGDYEGQPFFSMDFVDGVPLGTFIERTNITSPVVLAELCATIADAAQYAHENGIIHRDLKPGNILVDRTGTPIITDFGLAKDLDSGSLMSVTGDVLGTPAYMSPEQATGDIAATDERTDVYALGAILYALLTRREPFKGKTVLETLSRVIHDAPPSVTAVNPEVDGELGAICTKAMEKQPAARYPSAREFAKDLRRFIDGYPVQARPWNRRRTLAYYLRRHCREVVLAGVAFLIVILVGLASPAFFSKRYLDIARSQLQATDPAARAGTVDALAREILEPREIRDKDVPAAVALLLSVRGDADAAPRLSLLRFLSGHGDHNDVNQAVALNMTAWLVDRAEQSPTPEERHAAIAALGAIRRPEHAAYLLRRLEEPNPLLRMKIVRALGEQRTRQALTPLIRLTVHDPECRAEAEAALALLYAEGRVTVFDRHDHMAKAALKTLTDAVSLQSRQMEEALAGLSGEPPPADNPFASSARILQTGAEETQLKAIYELDQSGDPAALPLLYSVLEVESEDVGTAAARAIGRVGGRHEIPTLVEKLAAPEARPRGRAAMALGFTGAEEAVDPLLLALVHEKDEAACRSIVAALGELGRPEAEGGLRQAAAVWPVIQSDVERAIKRLRGAP